MLFRISLRPKGFMIKRYKQRDNLMMKYDM